MNKLLSIKNLNKVYYTKNDWVEAIRDITLDIYEGEFVSIVGPSGCGKSTLLNILTDMDKLTGGNITFMDGSIKLGYMLQSDSLLPWKNIIDNATLGLDIEKKLDDTSLSYVRNLLNTYGLGGFLKSFPKELSGGMRQRVALIRTLALNPDILILDEPFSKLDYQSGLKVSDDVYKIIKKEGKSAIMVTHDLAMAISLSDRVVVLSNRPATIKNIYNIKRVSNKGPIENRSDPNFSYYYECIWRDLDKCE